MSLTKPPNKTSTIAEDDNLLHEPRAWDVFETSGRYYDPIRHALRVYRRTKNLYSRTMKAMGRQPITHVSVASTKGITVSNNGSAGSTS